MEVSVHHDNVMCGLQVRSSDKTPLLTCLLEGPGGAGKTALAASMGIDSDYPFVKVVSAQNYVGYTEAAKCQAIAKVFDDAYKVRTDHLSAKSCGNIHRMQLGFSVIAKHS